MRVCEEVRLSANLSKAALQSALVTTTDRGLEMRGLMDFSLSLTANALVPELHHPFHVECPDTNRHLPSHLRQRLGRAGRLFLPLFKRTRTVVDPRVGSSQHL